jgi:hypothetical protein
LGIHAVHAVEVSFRDVQDRAARLVDAGVRYGDVETVEVFLCRLEQRLDFVWL